MASRERRTIRVEHLARVEGEGALHLTVEGGVVREVRLTIHEPPRFFEGLLRGRGHREVADIVARICGICPVAYQMSALHAIESILGIQIAPEVRELRRLFYCGEWLESHTLHVAFLAAPDALGYASVVEMAADHPADVRRALELRRLGNRILEVLGGRAIHPVSACPGGFTRVPSLSELVALEPELERARERALELLTWAARFELRPRPLDDVELVSLRHPHEYPLNEGRIVSSAGLDVAIGDWERTFEEVQVEHSTALHARIRDRGSYLVGPIARVSLNFEKLGETVRSAARAIGFTVPCLDPAQGAIARSLEVLFAVEEALRIVTAYRPPEVPFVAAEPRAGVGYGATEAPRGTLFHRFELDERGLVTSARIVPPTSQNQATIESDLRDLAPELLTLSHEDATHACEVAIRNYDPCISCATHFLTLTIERRDGEPRREHAAERARASVAASEHGASPTAGRPRVVCVGTPRGADRLGLAVAERLRARAVGAAAAAGGEPSTSGVPILEVIATDQPVQTLAEWVGDGAPLIVVDAVLGGERGALVELPLSALLERGAARGVTSSHGFGLGDALALSRALGRSPQCDRFVGVAIGDAGHATEASDVEVERWCDSVVVAIDSLCEAF